VRYYIAPSRCLQLFDWLDERPDRHRLQLVVEMVVYRL